MPIVDFEKCRECGIDYCCDECKEVFPAAEITLERRDNFHFSPGDDVLQTEDGAFVACPRCKHIHLYGFDRAKEALVAQSG